MVITGTVTDSETGEPLPAAAIVLTGTYRGTTTNTDGQFSLAADSLPSTLLVRYIGYEQQTVTVQDANRHLDIALVPAITEMPEIVITGEDPALSIMERVIARKQIWRANLTSYEATAYTRHVIMSDTTIVSISESGTVAWWDALRGHREEQFFTEQTSNLSDDMNFAGVGFFPNLYDDNIDVAGFSVMGITHRDALRNYRFRLLETTELDGHPVYHIEVRAARRLQPLFEGSAWVLGGEYALLEVDLQPNDVVRFPPPIQELDIRYSQQFSSFGADFWLPVDMRVVGWIEIGLPGLRFPAIALDQVSQVSGYRVNVPVPDTLFARNRSLVRMDSVRAAERMPELNRVPLSMRETTAYEHIDSTDTFEQAFRPTGVLARFVNESSDADNGAGRNAAASERGLIANLLSDFSPVGGYNRAGGFAAGLAWERRFGARGQAPGNRGPGGGTRSQGAADGPNSQGPQGAGGNSPGPGRTMPGGLTTSASAQWHSRLPELTWQAEVRQRLTLRGERNRRFAGARYHSGLTRRLDTGLYPEVVTGAVALLGGEDYFDYYRSDRLSIYYEVPTFWLAGGVPAGIKAGLHFGKDRSIEHLLPHDYSLFGTHQPRRPLPAIDDGILHTATLELLINRPERSYGVISNRHLTVSVEQSLRAPEVPLDNARSGSGYTLLTLDFLYSQPTLLTRRIFPNALHISGRAGYTIGHLPYQRYGVLDGSLTRFTPFGTLKTRPGLPYEGDRFMMLAAEHDFQSVPFELLGMRYPTRKGWGMLLFAGAGTSSSSRPVSPDTLQPFTTNGWHLEAGISVNRIFGLFRVDVALRLDDPGAFVGVSLPRYF